MFWYYFNDLFCIACLLPFSLVNFDDPGWFVRGPVSIVILWQQGCFGLFGSATNDDEDEEDDEDDEQLYDDDAAHVPLKRGHGPAPTPASQQV